jgi:hypothetical protein
VKNQQPRAGPDLFGQWPQREIGYAMFKEIGVAPVNQDTQTPLS